MKTVHLYRHTDNDGDALTERGIAAARALAASLTPPYDALVSTGAARATQMLEIFRQALGPQAPEVTVEPSLRSYVEDRWRASAKAAGSSELEAIRRVDNDLVEQECVVLGRALGRVFDLLPEGGRGLVVGHSPTNEAAVCGLTGIIPEPLGKGEGLAIVREPDGYEVEPL
jgi:broad specificity phosphatase PhoE